MTLDQVWSAIQRCAGDMNARYQGVVFDELAIVSFSDSRARTLSYQGPRREAFDLDFPADSAALRACVRRRGQEYGVGDFEFSHEGTGTGFEAFMVLGQDVCLVCNNTAKSMSAIAANPLWLSAQVPFVELAEALQGDPLVVQTASPRLPAAA